MALFNKDLLESIVLFEVKKGRKYRSIATGMVIGFKVSKRKNDDRHHTFILTNKHVFSGKTEIYVSFDSENEKRKRVNIPLLVGGNSLWLSHRYLDVDLALYPVSMKFLRENLKTSTKWIPESQFLYLSNYNNAGFSLGDSVFFSGFPLGLSGKIKNSPVLRTGSFAKGDSEMLTLAKACLIDGQNFPGNSGGPVFTKPEIAGLSDTKNIDNNYLLGIIKGYLPHTSYFVDPDNPTISVSTIENSGLALYVPIDYAKQIYRVWVKEGKKPKV